MSMARISKQRAMKALNNQPERVMLNGDRKGHTRALVTAKDAGVILPEDEDRFNMEFDRNKSKAALAAGIEEDSDIVLEAIGNLTVQPACRRILAFTSNLPSGHLGFSWGFARSRTHILLPFPPTVPPTVDNSRFPPHGRDGEVRLPFRQSSGTSAGSGG